MPWPMRLGPEPRMTTDGRAGVDRLVGPLQPGERPLGGQRELAQLTREPRVDAGPGADLLLGRPLAEGLEHDVEAPRVRPLQAREQVAVQRRRRVDLARA